MSKAINTSGKRKEAIARATLKPGKGMIIVNGQALDVLEPRLARMKMSTPLVLAGEEAKKVDISVRVQGGGTSSQAEAVALAMAKALAQHQKKLEKVFLEYDRHLLVADVRRREERKPNRRGKARSKRQKSYR